jgi:uncharacterized protein
MAESRSDVMFPSGDAQCAAWLYRPQPPAKDSPAPIVILGHGLGCIREMGLDRYAARFADAGFAALAFDYRHFGASGGEPRQLLDIDHQLQDWASAIAYARTLSGVDLGRLALWGTSFGGGHVIEVAARDGQVAAVVAQCPFTDGPSSMRTLGLRSNLKVFPLLARDQIAATLGTSPVMVKLVGPPGSAALMPAPDAEPGYRALIPPDVSFVDEVAARIGLHLGLYRPGRTAAKVRCPILFCVCEHDSVAPAGPSLRAAQRAPRGELRSYPIGHFDIYRGEPFERAVAEQLDFLRRHLTPGSTS